MVGDLVGSKRGRSYLGGGGAVVGAFVTTAAVVTFLALISWLLYLHGYKKCIVMSFALLI